MGMIAHYLTLLNSNIYAAFRRVIFFFIIVSGINFSAFSGNLITVNPSSSVCPGTQMTLSAGTVNDVVDWYTLPGGLLLSNSNNYSFQFNNTVSIVVNITHPDLSVSSDTAHITFDTGDSDSDGTTNCNDGCPNDPAKIAPGACGCGASEADFDNDGAPNCIDGCPVDANKTSPGTCGCGIPDTNTDGDVLPDCLDQCPNDPNKLFPGSCGCGTADTDSDGDGVPNCIDGCPFNPTKVAPGVCGCNNNDIDSDNDGVLNCNDGCPFDANKLTPGQCGCGVVDTDSDSDGVADCNDGCPNDPNKTAPGICGCGVADTDNDSDGTPNCNDQCPNDPNKTAPGVCGCGTPDTDSDNDGTPDCNDQCPNDPTKIVAGICGCNVVDTDTDNDGVQDCNDGCPNDPNKIAGGLCGCGVADTDSDNDGTPDCNDACPADPDKSAPGICGCGVADTDDDNDGTPNCNDQCPNDPNKVAPGQCGCGNSDADTDNDGTSNCNDLCPNDPNKITPGICGCGVSDLDSDNDGTSNCNDLCPNDLNKIAPGVCGCGVADTDTDSDGTPDCIDPCPFGILVLDTATTQSVCGPDGTANVSVTSGGSGSYNYIWSTGGTTATITGLYPLNYRVTVTDNNTGCSDSIGAVVTPMQGTFFVLGFDSTGSTCFGGNNGSATAIVSGGIGPFTYLWSNNATTSVINNLTAGIYQITAIDQATGCTGYGAVEIISPQPYVADLGPDKIVCPGIPVTLEVTNAVNANWYDANGTLLLSNNTSYSLSTGINRTIVVQAFDATNCIDYDTTNLVITTIDTDSDGTPDCIDNCPLDPNKINPGTCGCGVSDLDSDNDGTPDCNDECPTDPNKIIIGFCGCFFPEGDTDNDGTPDCADGCPNDINKIAPGICGCGTSDNDDDNDGTPNCNDQCPTDPNKILPGLCGCGNVDTDDDGDGFPNCFDLCPNDPNKIAPGTCGCGTADTDSDNDGVPNCFDLCPNDPNKLAPGICGCGTTETDSDNDGTPDCFDGCPLNPLKTSPGQCGCGTLDIDNDNDGTADCNDLCPFDANKIVPGFCGCNNPETDSDSDGLPDCADSCPLGDLIISTSVTDILCGADGAAGVAVIGGGGSGSYSYAWSNSATAPAINNIFAGNYTVTVIDNIYGCSDTLSITVDVDHAAFFISNVDTNHATCFGANDGSVNIQIANGVGPFTYSWTPNVSSTSSANNLSPGTYAVLVTDNFTSCTAQAMVNISGPAQYIINVGPDKLSCGGTLETFTVLNADSVNWKQLNGTLLRVNSFSYSFTFISTTSIVAEAFNQAGCVAYDTITLTIDIFDSDNDGTSNCNDLCPNDPFKIAPGVCGCGNIDFDSDNDGTPDCNDQCPNDANKTVPGLCGCGLPEGDTDGDGTPDCFDFCVSDSTKTVPGICGCGVPDIDSDSDGVPDCIDFCPADPLKSVPGFCGCNNVDIDSDFDGVFDCNDACPNDGSKSQPGVCGCNVPDIDSDIDGTLDCNDQCPFDPNKILPGSCGCGNPDNFFVDAGTNETICEGNAVILFATGGNDYLWSNGTPTDINPVAPLTTTTYYVTVTNNICSAVDSVIVTVLTKPVIYAGVDDTVCEGSAYTLKVTGGVLYSWNNGINDSLNTVVIYQNTTFDVIGFDTNGCFASDTVTLFTIAAPVADAGNSVTICEGTTTTLTATGGNQYLWSNGDSVATTEVSPLTTTVYSVTVTDTMSGCSATDDVMVEVNPAPQVDAGPGYITCEGDTRTLVATGNGLFLWSTSETTASISVSPLTTTVYTITAINNFQCEATDSATVYVNPLPIADAGNDVEICIGNDVALTASGGVKYLWNTGDTLASTIVAPVLSQQYDVLVTDSNGCMNTDDVFVTVNELPLVSAGNDRIICAGDSVIVFATGADNYIWSNGQTDPAFVDYPAASTAYVVLGTDANGCSNTDEMTVTVYALPDVSVSGNTEICFGNIVELTASGAAVYIWEETDTTATFIRLPVFNTDYSLEAIDSNGCSSTISVGVTVNDIYNADIIGLDEFYCSNRQSVFLEAFPSGGVFSGNGVNGSNLNPYEAGEGAHTITYVFTDINGCASIDTAAIEIITCPGIDEDNIIASLKVYPNPFSENIMIEWLNNSETIHAVTLFDIAGKEIATKEYHTTGNIQFETPHHLPAGNYTLQIQTEQATYKMKMIKAE
jgi:hypothetical protein